MKHPSIGRGAFYIANTVFLSVLALSCLIPFINVLAVSFSSNEAIAMGAVKLWPVGFSTRAYEFVAMKKAFHLSLGVSGLRVLLGVAVSMFIVMITAYPLSKEVRAFRARTVYSWFFVFTILFYGGLVPWFLVVKDVGLMNSIWGLILPRVVNVFNILLALNFFRTLPKEMEESAFMDGAGHWTVLFRIILPTSLPVLATVTLLTMVYFWNEWFDALILMNNPEKYPLQTYMRSIIVSSRIETMNEPDEFIRKYINVKNVNAAQIFLGCLPILLVYPFLQRFFMKGIVLGSVKE